MENVYRTPMRRIWLFIGFLALLLSVTGLIFLTTSSAHAAASKITSPVGTSNCHGSRTSKGSEKVSGPISISKVYECGSWGIAVTKGGTATGSSTGGKTTSPVGTSNCHGSRTSKGSEKVSGPISVKKVYACGSWGVEVTKGGTATGSSTGGKTHAG
jgi:hypothetical protein